MISSSGMRFRVAGLFFPPPNKHGHMKKEDRMRE
jgi:hypothetical protein